MFGSATERQGRRISGSGSRLCPRGEMVLWRQSASETRMPPAALAAALALAAPSTPSPAPGRVNPPNSGTVRAGKMRK